ncbi:MAG: DMT family transporter, partial [Nitrospinota bacterium]|nr:DMT family transporter [Nitrospinota bacterium]
MAFFYIGVQRIGAARAATIKSAAPVYAVICAVVFLGERPGVLQFFGIVAVIVGVLTIVSESETGTPPDANPPDADPRSAEHPRTPAKRSRGRNFDLLFPLLAGVCTGLAAVLYKFGFARLDSPLLAAWTGATVALFILPLIALLFPKPDRRASGLDVGHSGRAGHRGGDLLSSPVHRPGGCLCRLHPDPDLPAVRRHHFGRLPAGDGEDNPSGRFRGRPHRR